MKFRNLLCALALIVGGVTLSAQEAFVATYTFAEYGPHQLTDTLTYANGLAEYRRFSPYQEHQDENGYTFYYYDQDLRWYLDLNQQQILDQSIAKDGTPIYARYPADFTWEITEETKVMHGYTVQKAIAKKWYDTNGNGDWDPGTAIAWFTLDVPVGIGPGRYYGLPGLIVALEFTKRPIRYTLQTLTYTDEITPLSIPAPQGIEVASAEVIRPGKIDKKWLKTQKKVLGLTDK